MEFQVIATLEDSPCLIPFGEFGGGAATADAPDSPRQDTDSLDPGGQASGLFSIPRSGLNSMLLAGEMIPASESSLPTRTTDIRGAFSMSPENDALTRLIVPITCLPSSSDYDANHPNLDAHSPAAEAVLAVGEALLCLGSNFLQVCLRTSEILCNIRTQVVDGGVNSQAGTLDNHHINSAISKLFMIQNREGSHVSILGMEFTPRPSNDFSKMFTQVKSIKIFLQNPSEFKPQFTMMIDCAWDPVNRQLRAVAKDLLSYVAIFYWRSPYIELRLELCYDKVSQSSATDVPHPALGVNPPQPLIMAPLHVPGGDRILYHLPEPNFAHMQDTLSPHSATLLDNDVLADSSVKIREVAYEGSGFRVQLDSTLLYSIIKDKSVGKPYPLAFRTVVPVEDGEISILLTVIPFKSRSRHISVWAKISVPSQSSGQVTLNVTAYDPRKEERLGRTIKCTEKLKHSDLSNRKEAKVTLDEVMLHMFAFYRVPSVELNISISIST